MSNDADLAACERDEIRQDYRTLRRALEVIAAETRDSASLSTALSALRKTDKR